MQGLGTAASVAEITPANRRGPSLWVYFVQGENGGPIKIGRARNLWWRVRGLQAGNWVEIVLVGAVRGARELERALHVEFSSSKIRGEWFRDTPALRQRIIELCEKDGLLDRRALCKP